MDVRDAPGESARRAGGEFGGWCVRMAGESPTWGYTRILGALENVGHRVGRSTIARVLEAAGVPPVHGAADVVADVPAGALGRDRGRRFLHDGGLAVARALATFYTVLRRRPGVAPRARSSGLDAVSR